MTTVVYDGDAARAVAGRYADAYLIARGINGIGGVIKGFGIFIGVLMALAGLVSIAKGGMGVLIGFAMLGVASGFATLFYFFGMLAAAQGQILKATLDTAVNTSAFLSTDDRAAVMSLRRTAGQPAPAPSRVASAASWDCQCGRSNHWSHEKCPECGMPATA